MRGGQDFRNGNKKPNTGNRPNSASASPSSLDLEDNGNQVMPVNRPVTMPKKPLHSPHRVLGTACRSFLRRPLHLQLQGHKVDRRLVAKDAQPTDHTHSLVTQVTVMAPRLPCMHVGDMQLDEWDLNAQ